MFSPQIFIAHLGTFGIGIALYFASIRWFGIMLLVAGLFNIPSMYFYAKGKYHNQIEDLPILYRFSAVCGNTEPVTCSDCVASDFGSDRVLYDDNLGEVFLKNKCSADDLFHGYFHCISILILFGAVFYLQFYQGKNSCLTSIFIKYQKIIYFCLNIRKANCTLR